MSSFRSTKPLLLLIVLAAIPTPVLSAGSRYANDDPDSCQIIGDTNIYGLGIRLGYYFQFIAAVLSTYLAPEQLNNICLAFGATTLGSFAALYENASRGYFIAVDWHVVVTMALGLTLGTFFFNPGARAVTPLPEPTLINIFIPTWVGGTIKRSIYGPWGAVLLIDALYLLTIPWMTWKGIYIGHKEGCSADFIITIFVASWNVDIYNHLWSTFFKVLSIFGGLLGVVLAASGIILLLVAVTTRIIREERVYEERGLKWTYTFMELFLGATTIMMVELMIPANEVDLSATPLSSTGQLIPLLVGALTLAVVFLTWLRKMASSLGPVSIFDGYFNFMSKTGDRIEGIFVKPQFKGKGGVEAGEPVEVA
jgi:hypothetical protein